MGLQRQAGIEKVDMDQSHERMRTGLYLDDGGNSPFAIVLLAESSNSDAWKFAAEDQIGMMSG